MLKDKVVVVTGGSGLLGGVFCTGIAEEGGVAIIADLDATRGESLAMKITASGGRAEFVWLDITDLASVDALIAGLHARHGRIDAVVNCAYPRNSQWGRPLEEITYSGFCENVSSHLGGYFLVAQRFSLYFREHGGGSVVNLSSIYGTMNPRFELYLGTGMSSSVEYAAIKSAIVQLTRYFAKYFLGDGVRVNTLSPGGILDNQAQSFVTRYNEHCGTTGMLEPRDVVGTLIFLLSDASRNITGQNITVDDGFSL